MGNGGEENYKRIGKRGGRLGRSEMRRMGERERREKGEGE